MARLPDVWPTGRSRHAAQRRWRRQKAAGMIGRHYPTNRSGRLNLKDRYQGSEVLEQKRRQQGRRIKLRGIRRGWRQRWQHQ